MENAEEVLQILERFTKLKQKDIPKELDEYLAYVAKTGDTVFTWANIKYLFREKLIHVIKDFHDSTSNVDDLPQYPNVDPFNYETMKTALLERLELFNSAPFTIQRICELLTNPKKQYSRIDKYMRALEKNILVVSTIEPGRKQPESENGDSLDSVVISLDVNVDIEMENENIFNVENSKQNGSNGTTTATINNKSEAENNKTHDDVELPTAKKLKLEMKEEKALQNEVNKDGDKINDESVTEKDSDKTEDDVISSTTKDDKKEMDQDKNDDLDGSPREIQAVKSCEKTESESIETNSKDNQKEESKEENINEENGDEGIEKEDLGDTKSSNNEIKKTDEPTQEEEDKLLNVDDEPTVKTTDVAPTTDENVSEKQEEIPLEDSKPKPPEEASPSPETKNDVDKNVSDSKTCEQDEEKKIELFSTDDVIDPSEGDKKSLQPSESEANIQVNAEQILEKINEVEEKSETISNNAKEHIVEEHKQKQTEEMAVEESNIQETTDAVKKIEEEIPRTEVLTTTDTQEIPEPIPEIESTPITDTQVTADQPMEDPSISDNPVDIETTAAETTPCVEMQTADSNEMATDDVPPAKIDDKLEIAGMDVDDVSQGEAMDQ
ncbi:serine/threonine-protein phosphatase 4 regulatory subunit 2 [Condylostylus longicornis]|uniref:serine/threonine-protein phosphatase 4 regulatory subunit 2 n=1 Tax=Condylostylus longicornis TaxID=2530218 RepID=UPI00244E251B|nr:serine/threonine-protein phosphatase 4 regulatory subunit 2 [Condylostylus longicornis]XP_055388982.1 serine/threonine-protein phosphatase 4 regulatory subunit 2 [Condylostylus longicornis]